MFIPFATIVWWLVQNNIDRVELLAIALVLIYVPTMLAFCLVSKRNSRELYAGILSRENAGVFPRPVWEYRSHARLFGLPLVHIRIGDRFSVLKEPATAWIAVGHHAIGGLFGLGCVAIAPVSVGWLSIGLLSVGGLSVGILSLGGIALGVWSLFGGLAAGWQSVGYFAIAWNAAVGNIVLAHGFALGHITLAAQMNNDAARQFVNSNGFFRCGQFLARHWLWLNLLWLIPSCIQWGITLRRRRATK